MYEELLLMYEEIFKSKKRKVVQEQGQDISQKKKHQKVNKH